jgi:hypothetical protein
MKTKASTFLKQMVSTIVAVVKAKSTVVRAKTSTLKTRLLIIGILRNKKLLMAAINTKIHAIIGHQQQGHVNGNNKKDNGDASASNDDDEKAVVLYSVASAPSYSFSSSDNQEAAEAGDIDDDDYLTHTLFADEDDELVRAPGSVIDVMRDAREREGGDGADFRLEDEIDHVADVFIRRIHRQLKLQKLDSFKRFWEMLERGAA